MVRQCLRQAAKWGRVVTVTRRRIEAALDTLGDLTAEEHEELDGPTRDEIGHIRYVLGEIADKKARRS